MSKEDFMHWHLQSDGADVLINMTQVAAVRPPPLGEDGTLFAMSNGEMRRIIESFEDVAEALGLPVVNPLA